MTTVLGDASASVDRRLSEWREADAVRRLWKKDHTLWVAEPRPEITDRLGWLTLPDAMAGLVPDLEAFAKSVRDDGLTQVVLLGMGGSSLAPEVFRRTLGVAQGFPELMVLDSTHPQAVLDVTEHIDPATTLFLVASKSGTTIEPLSFLEYFWSLVPEDPGSRFAAITDPGTPLAALGEERGFRRVFEAIPDVGGRYSALTHFGLVPAALIGADVEALLESAQAMAHGASIDGSDAVRLGAALGELALAGRDKATFVVSESLTAFPAWIEQLVAESTGKDGTGIVPIAEEALGAPEVYGDDRCFVWIGFAEDDPADASARLEALEGAGHPVIRISVDRLTDLGAEMYRAEVAVAMAGSVLGIHPFNQPNVQLAKGLAREAIEGSLDAGAIQEVPADEPARLTDELATFLAGVHPGDFVGLQAFIRPGEATTAALQRIRHTVRDRRRVATTVGYGPRFLHSTGQLHKGGAPNGAFIQIVDHATPDLAVPGADFTFGRLIAGQADGDHQALREAGRRVIRVCLGDDVPGGLRAIEEALNG